MKPKRPCVCREEQRTFRRKRRYQCWVCRWHERIDSSAVNGQDGKP